MVRKWTQATKKICKQKNEDLNSFEENYDILEEDFDEECKSYVKKCFNESTDMFQDSNDNTKDVVHLLESDNEDENSREHKENPTYVYACDMCSFETPDNN